MRGYEVKPHASAEISARLGRTAELYGTLTVDTQLYEPLRAALFQARCLRLALESGDAIIIARASSRRSRGMRIGDRTRGASIRRAHRSR